MAQSDHTIDHFDGAQNDAIGPSSNCPSKNVDIHGKPSTNASILQYKLDMFWIV